MVIELMKVVTGRYRATRERFRDGRTATLRDWSSESQSIGSKPQSYGSSGNELKPREEISLTVSPVAQATARLSSFWVIAFSE